MSIASSGKRSHAKGNNADLSYNTSARRMFERLKRTPEFVEWKHRQYEVQKGRCAWCYQFMPRTLEDVHVDHALALYHGGSNAYGNLVLAHGQCNLEKWVRVDGTPQWIKNNEISYGRRELLSKQRAIMEQYEYDMKMARWMGAWV